MSTAHFDRRLARLEQVHRGDDGAKLPLFVYYGAGPDTSPAFTPYDGGRKVVIRDGEPMPSNVPKHSIRVFVPCELPPQEMADPTD